MHRLFSSFLDAVLEKFWGYVIGAVVMVVSPLLYSQLEGASQTWVWFGSGCLAAFGWTLLVVAWARTKRKVLIIHSALYGIGENSFKDVTVPLRGYIKNNKINVPVTNQTFWCDPYPGVRKHLKVSYSYFKLTPQEIVRHENDQLILPEED